jgi:ABC-type branched-subunit amino acid transport system ATPase component
VVSSNGNGRGHVAAIHRAEDLVDDIEHEQERLRERARRLLGVGETAEPPPLRDTVAESGVGWYPLVALGVLIVVDQFQSWGFFILGPEISAALGIGRGTLTFLVLLKTLAVMLASLPMAAYVQARPRRHLVAKVTAFGWAAATLLTGFVVNVWGVLLVLVGDGASTGSVEAVHRPLLMDSYPPEGRVRALTAYRAAGAAGTIIAPLLVGLVTVLGFTWRGVFVAMGILCIGAAVLSLRLRDPGFGRFDLDRVRGAVRADTEVGGGAAGAERGAGDDPQLGFFEICRRLLLIPTMRRLMAAWAVFGMLFAPMLTFLFFFLDEQWDMGAAARSLFLAGVWVLALPALAVFGRRAEGMFRDDPGSVVRIASKALVVFVAAIVVAALSPWFVPMLLGFAVVFAAAALIQPALNVVMLSIIPPYMRPHASALAGIFFAGVGGIGGLLLLNGVDRRFGIGGAIVSMTVPAVLAALILRTTAGTVNDDLDRMIDEIVEREEIEIVRARGLHLPMLSCRHVDFSYGQLQVLFDVNFTVDDGEMVALLGTNGAGKSTLLRVISGLGLPSRGSVHFTGADITYLDAERRLNLGITQIPGGKATFGPLTVLDNLRVYGHSLGRDTRALDAGIDATFGAFPRLDERRHQLASTLSGGEQQMLALGKAFILKPRLLLIDELSLGLAPKIVSDLLEMVRRINAAGTAVVLVEQSVNIALSLVDHAYFMEKGEIRFDGAAADLLGRTDLLRSVFLEGATKGLGA